MYTPPAARRRGRHTRVHTEYLIHPAEGDDTPPCIHHPLRTGAAGGLLDTRAPAVQFEKPRPHQGQKSMLSGDGPKAGACKPHRIVHTSWPLAMLGTSPFTSCLISRSGPAPSCVCWMFSLVFLPMLAGASPGADYDPSWTDPLILCLSRRVYVGSPWGPGQHL